MKELTLEYLYARIMNLKTESKIAFDATVVLQFEAMESSLRIRDLEKKVEVLIKHLT